LARVLSQPFVLYPFGWTHIVKGVVLIVAVLADVYFKKNK
jgi:ABC-type xylose transport system permease subunit